MSIKRRADARGRAQPVRRPKPHELARRLEIALELRRLGHSNVEIGRALDCDPGSLVRWGLPPRGTGQGRPGRGPVENPPPWRDEDMPAEPVVIERWRTSKVTARVAMLVDDYRDSSFANVLGNHVDEAIEAGDHQWVEKTGALLDVAAEMIERLQRVVRDPAYRKQCTDTIEGDEIARRPTTTPLRSVG